MTTTAKPKTGRRRSGRSTPSRRKLDMDELEDIIERAGRALTDEDREKLRETIETLAWLQDELGKKNVAVRRLRSLLGIDSSEKSSRILKDVEKSGSADDAERGEGERKSTEPQSRARPKAKGHGRNGADAYEGAEHVTVVHPELSSGDPCPTCPPENRGIVYMQGRPRTIVRIVGRAPLQAKVYELERLRCNLCGKVFTADLPPGDPGQKYDPTAIAMIALLKYGSGFPFNRLERLESHVGIPLPSSTQWDLVCAAADQLGPVYQELIRQAAQGDVIHNDDTSMRVVSLRQMIEKELERGESKRTGIFSTGIVSKLSDGRRIALYFTGRQHAGENIAEVLAKREAGAGPPMQMCDALAHNAPKEFQTLLANCLVHARRKFVEVVNSFPDECRFVIETLRDVYANDAEAGERDLSAEDRLRFHQEHSQPLMAALEEWMQVQFKEKLVEPNSGLGGAIRYMQKRWIKLTRFLREAGAPLDNNVCERALKKAVLHRKNALFYRTENGARVGDLFMAFIHTAELADANPLDYLAALLRNTDDVSTHPGRWLPWNYPKDTGTDVAAEASG